MKKWLFILAFLFIPFSANAQVPERIVDYTVVVSINSDSTAHIAETIQYDFGSLDRHGIFRIIPYRYRSNVGNVTVPISDIRVLQDDRPAQFSLSKQSGTLEIKIGDPNTTLSGQHVYKLTYTVSRAMGYFNDHDELYWNAIGTAWQVPILRSSVFVVLPSGVDMRNVKTDCFAGPQGAVVSNCVIDNGRVEEGSLRPEVVFSPPGYFLNPEEGLTFVVGLPKGIVHQPTKSELVWQRVADNWVVIIPIAIFFLLFYVWRKHGKDPKGRGTVVPEYDPPKGLTPIEVGTLVDGRLDRKDISAEIIFLAEQGYLTIKQIETKTLLVFKATDYEFTKKKDSQLAQSTIDQKILDLFFKDGDVVKLSDFKSDAGFAQKLHDATKKVYTDLVAKGYYRSNPSVVTSVSIVVGIVLGFVITIFAASVYGVVGFISGAVSGVVMVIFGALMAARTKKGSEVRDQILGLKLYMSVAEKDRLAFHNAPEKTPERFEKLLPFAMALGVEKAWAKQFEGIYERNPSWYSGTHVLVLNPVSFVSEMSSLSDSVRSVVAANASRSGGGGFGGGGFSGGGGGGGGGGSW